MSVDRAIAAAAALAAADAVIDSSKATDDKAALARLPRRGADADPKPTEGLEATVTEPPPPVLEALRSVPPTQISST